MKLSLQQAYLCTVRAVFDVECGQDIRLAWCDGGDAVHGLVVVNAYGVPLDAAQNLLPLASMTRKAPTTEPQMQHPETLTAELLAIVSVAKSARVQCQNPGCGHGVYAAVHVVDEGGRILVLGSKCYRTRYGHAAQERPSLAGSCWGSGQPLSEEDRQLLQSNSTELIAQFRQRLERETEIAHQRQQRRQRHRPALDAVKPMERPASGFAAAPPPPRKPWPWQHASNTSVAVLRGPDGQCWVRVQHRDGSQKLAPWPVHEGWDEALPPSCGVADLELGAYAVPDIVAALRWLQAHGFSAPQVSRWPEVLKILPEIS